MFLLPDAVLVETDVFVSTFIHFYTNFKIISLSNLSLVLTDYFLKKLQSLKLIFVALIILTLYF